MVEAVAVKEGMIPLQIHGVDKVLLAARHATVTKSPETDWEMLQPNVELVMSQFFEIPNVKPVRINLAVLFS